MKVEIRDKNTGLYLRRFCDVEDVVEGLMPNTLAFLFEVGSVLWPVNEDEYIVFIEDDEEEDEIPKGKNR
jgi:hypothetical protein